ncbi:MAG: phosphatase PAP2 family protein [Thermomicrobiales bacterium]
MSLALLVVAALGLTVVAVGPGTLPWDVAIALRVQRVPAAVGAPLARVGYWAGSAAVVYAVGAALIVLLGRRQLRREVAVLAGVLIVRALNTPLKVLVASPRPIDGQVLISELATGNGFPSGHMFGATLLYGAVIWIAARLVPSRPARWAIQGIAAMLIAVTGFDRIYSGAHWPSDVLGGLLWGLVGLLAVILVSGRLVPDGQPLEGKA